MNDNRYCENTIIENDKEYKLEKIWKTNKSDKTYDAKGIKFPYPKENEGFWPEKKNILEILANIEKMLQDKNRIIHYDKNKNCLLCNKKNVASAKYKFSNIMWENSLYHYIDVHNIEPSIQFKKFIFNINIKNKKKKKLNNESDSSKIILSRVIKEEKEYVMIERNQLLILDALMIHGGYEKKYVDLENNFSRYSEHAGFLDFEGNSLSKIIVSGKTNRIDEGDEEIYLPMGLDEMFEYEYIFHTHPPTPKPGGRADDGILYEMPSINDIFHFIDHHNEGNVIGSLVVTAEGLYNIRKANNNINDIKIDEDDMYKKYQRTFNKIQKDAIDEYGTKFTNNTFYSVIAQNASFITKMNSTLNQFDIHIDYYPRKKDMQGEWIIDTIFLVFRKNKPNK